MKYKYLKGIYLIERINNINNNEPIYYIGQSNNLFTRLQYHFSNLNNQEIDKAINKYGIESFIFKILKIEDSQKQRDILEKYYINNYINKYGINKLYNRTDGGKENQHLINQERDIINKNIKNEIINILNKTIDYSIYLLAEKFNLNFQEIINIRKPLLKEHNLQYNYFKRCITYIDTKLPPEIWRAYIITKNQFNIWSNNKDKLEKEQLADKMNISLTDLKIFEKNYSVNYILADDLFK